MSKRNIIVVGASAGGVTALTHFASKLPENFKGTVFVVLHVPATATSILPSILSNAGPLPAIHPKDGEKIEEGKVYVAPNNYHLLLEDGEVLIRIGPKENLHRPSIDALFRSAAYIYRERVIGVILSGTMNDGVSGLWTIKRLGGLAIVQKPEDAEFAALPENALEYVDADYVATATEIGQLIGRVSQDEALEKIELTKEEMADLETEVNVATYGNALNLEVMNLGVLTPYTCPECHAPLVEIQNGNITRYRCNTGHGYTADVLLTLLSSSVEALLWQSLRSIDEVSMLMNSIGAHYEKMHNPDAAAMMRSRAKANTKRANIIHEFLLQQDPQVEGQLLPGD